MKRMPQLIEVNPDINIGSTFSNISEAIIKKYNKAVDDIIETSVREFAKPPIKGEITKGKLKWRGLRLCQTDIGLCTPMKTWVEQRGERISPIITLGLPNYTHNYKTN